MKIGQGWDLHRLEEGQELIIGGVKIESTFGTIAHSDGDVLVHAIIDALLGAAAMGDIGRHFPDTKAEYKNANSLNLLKETKKKVSSAGYKIENIDSTIILQQPRLMDFIEDMRNNIAKTLCVDISKVSVKAKTSEKIGPVGEGLAIEAISSVLLERR